MDKAKPLLTLLRWLALAGVIGLGVGLAGAGFGLLLGWAAGAFGQVDWLLYLLPLAGVVIAALYRGAKVDRDLGTNLVLRALQEDKPLPLRMAPLISASTVLTHLFGGSAGREGAALQLGGSLAAGLGKLFRLDGREVRLATRCGMAAAFAALFGTPLTAALFALEVAWVGKLYLSGLLPCLVSALLGYQVSLWCGLSPTRFTLTGVPGWGLVGLGQAAVMGLLGALLSFLFCWVLHQAPTLYERIQNPYLRSAVGGALIIALTLLVGSRDYNGAGGAMIAAATGGAAVPPYAFLLKLLFTALTLGAGFKGGEIVPTLFVGATFGAVAGPLLGLGSSWGAGLGMIALFCGVTNCPISSLMLSLELFGGGGLPHFALAVAVAYALSGSWGLYGQQKLLCPKLESEAD